PGRARRGHRGTAERRALRNRSDRFALVLRVARAELQVLPGTAGIRHVEGSVDLGPGLLVDRVDVLGAEYPVKRQRLRVARRERLRVIASRERPLRRARQAVQRIGGAGSQARVGLGNVLGRGLTVALGPADLAV